MNSQKDGYLYIMINACLPKDMLKIGYTKREPEHRANELSQSTGLPSEFIVAYERLVADCEMAERLIHEKLRMYRTTAYRNDRSREFFKVKLKDAIKILDTISDEVGIGVSNPSTTQHKTTESTYLEFNQITATHSPKYKEEIETYRRIGFTKYPKRFLDPTVRDNSEKLYYDGINESIPGLASQKIYRAAYMGNIKAIKWIISKHGGLKFWGDLDTDFLIKVSNPSTTQHKTTESKYLEFNQITAEHSPKYKEEIETYKRIGFTQYPKRFLDPTVRARSEKLYYDGINESIPGLSLQKIYRAAYMGNVEAIKWLLSRNKSVHFSKDSNTDFLI